MAKAGTIAGDVEAMQAAMTDIMPPEQVKLREKDWPFWKAITRARARDTWTEIDLVHAANLARTQSDIEDNQAALDIEGFTLVNERGTTVANPRHSILETLSRRAVALSRCLQVHAHATVGESRDQVPKAKAQSSARAVAEKAKDDEFIARPH